MPKFVVERNWVEMIGPIWQPGFTCAQRKDLSSYDIEKLRDEDGQITRDSVEQWLTMNSGDFRYVEDFAAYINDFETPWADEESEWTYSDCMYPAED